MLDGQVSFWRPGDSDWSPARVNTPLAPGDVIATGDDGRAEIQIGGYAFARADARTEIELSDQEPDFTRFRLTNGRLSIDVRRIGRGAVVEIDTPQAAFTVDRAGYYRVEVDVYAVTLITRRGGRATATPADGEPVGIATNERVAFNMSGVPRLATDRAPDLDAWDRWNYERTDRILDAHSDRYIPADMYGLDDLDRYGGWRVVPRYGRVWVPASVPPGWVPYSTGRWLWDPDYGWTWVDDAPWGWAPYHYGRWVYVSSYWAWAPGPIAVAVTPVVYAPALVAFFGSGSVRVGIGVSYPFVGWVALGWGEPVLPWWGPPAFVGGPWWGGWCGPRIVNNIIVTNQIVPADDIAYSNAHVRNAIIAARREQFGNSKLARFERMEPRTLQPIRGTLPVKPIMHTTPAGQPARPATAERSVVTAAHNKSARLRAAHDRRAASPVTTLTSPLRSSPAAPTRGGASPHPRSQRLRESRAARPEPPAQHTTEPQRSVAPRPMPDPTRPRGRSERIRAQASQSRRSVPQIEHPALPTASVPRSDAGGPRPRRDRIRGREASTHARSAAPELPARDHEAPPSPPDRDAYTTRSDRLRMHAAPAPRIHPMPPAAAPALGGSPQASAPVVPLPQQSTSAPAPRLGSGSRSARVRAAR
jgi:hypothetical protein